MINAVDTKVLVFAIVQASTSEEWLESYLCGIITLLDDRRQNPLVALTPNPASLAQLMPDDSPKSRIASTLQRLAESNPHRVSGPGIQPGHYVPLCQYYNRKLAEKLCLRLEENGIDTKTNSTRLFVSVTVASEKCSEAIRILDAFKESHPDTQPRKFSRDYDLVFLILFATLVIAFFSIAAGRWLVPVAVTTSGVSLCIVVERWHRHKRYHNGMRFTLKDLLGLTIVCAINFAIWRLV